MLGLRLLMAIVGLCLLGVSLATAALAYLAVAAVLSLGLDPVSIALALVGGSLVAGLLSYAVGTEQLLSTVDAVPLEPHRAPGAFRVLDRLCAEMDVDEPELLVAHLGEPNAFSVRSPRRSAVIVDRSLFGLLERREFEAVLAHELAHVESGDALVQTLAYSLVHSLVGLLGLLVLPLVLVVTGLARAVAWLRGRPATWTRTAPGRVRAGIQLLLLHLLLVLTVAVRAHSRRREYAADRRAAEVTGTPLALASALRKIERATLAHHGPLATLYVRGEERDPLADLFSTHPDTEGRIERLRAMADGRRIEIGASAGDSRR